MNIEFVKVFGGDYTVFVDSINNKNLGIRLITVRYGRFFRSKYYSVIGNALTPQKSLEDAKKYIETVLTRKGISV